MSPPDALTLPARLSQTTLGDVLGTLHRAAVTGSLELVEAPARRAERRHLVELWEGAVTSVQSPGDTSLGEALVRATGEPLASRRARALGAVFATCPSEAACLALIRSRALIPPAELAGLLRELTRARLERLFALEDAALRFHACGALDAASAAVPSANASPSGRRLQRETTLPVADVLHGRPRARDRARPAGERAPAGDTRRAAPGRARALRVLGLDPHADAEAVRRAFRRLAAEAHPDRGATGPSSEQRRLAERFVELAAAYHALAG